MQITDRFTSEHQVFLRQLAFLESALDEPPEALAAIVRTLGGPLEAHAEAEEAFLFPDLYRFVGSDEGPVAVLTVEHRIIRDTVASLAAARDQSTARGHAERLIEVLRDHIAKEEEVVFPLASQLLGEERLRDLDADYAGPAARGARRPASA